eukprot:COSAG02_NODE_2644_length_8343_cov_16.256308_6_plen_333_part_00
MASTAGPVEPFPGATLSAAPWEGSELLLSSVGETVTLTDRWTLDMLYSGAEHHLRSEHDRSAVDAMGTVGAPVLVDGVVYMIPCGPCGVGSQLLAHSFADKKEYIQRTKRYLKRCRQHINESTVGSDAGAEACKAFMTGANLFVNRLLKIWGEMEFYVGSSASEDGMVVAVHYLGGVSPRLLVWAPGSIVAEEPGPEPEPQGPTATLSFCTFHHLLAGKSHEKERDMVRAASGAGLQGLIVYGTPGIVVIEDAPANGEAKNAATAFMKESRKIGKKGDVTFSVDVPLVDSEGESCSSGLFDGRGLTSVGLEELKALLAKLGHEEQYQAVLGM